MIGAHARLDRLPGIHACEGVERSSLRSPDPRRVELRPTRRPRNLEIRTGQNIRAAVRAHRGQPQAHVDGELRPAPQARASHGLSPLRKDGGQMRPEQTKPRHVSPAERTMGTAGTARPQRPSSNDRAPEETGQRYEPAPAPKVRRTRSTARDGTSVPIESTTPRREPRSPYRASEQAGSIQPRSARERATSNPRQGDQQEAADHRAARLHGLDSHGGSSRCRIAAMEALAGATATHTSLEEALITRATVSLTPGIVSLRPTSGLLSMLKRQRLNATHATRGSQQHLAFCQTARRIRNKPVRVETRKKRHGTGVISTVHADQCRSAGRGI